MNEPPAAPFLLGVTGNIGSGKSTVARLWASEHDAGIIEGDVLGRAVVNECEPFRAWLRERYGGAVFHGDELDRTALGRIVFSDRGLIDELNREIWPHIRARLEEQVGSVLASGRIAIVDAAMICEWKDEARYDVLVAVIVDPRVGAERAARRMQLTADELLQRYRMQLPADAKTERADFTLRNDGTRPELLRRARALWPEIVAHANQRIDRG